MFVGNKYVACENYLKRILRYDNPGLVLARTNPEKIILVCKYIHCLIFSPMSNNFSEIKMVWLQRVLKYHYRMAESWIIIVRWSLPIIIWTIHETGAPKPIVQCMDSYKQLNEAYKTKTLWSMRKTKASLEIIFNQETSLEIISGLTWRKYHFTQKKRRHSFCFDSVFYLTIFPLMCIYPT